MDALSKPFFGNKYATIGGNLLLVILAFRFARETLMKGKA